MNLVRHSASGGIHAQEQLYYDYVYVVHDFLSAQECQRYIELAESIGFDHAPITTAVGEVVRKDIRNNARAMKDDPDLASQLWERAKSWAISPWRDMQAVGLNERFRFYKYTAGQTFAPHFDGAFVRDNGERSEFTFMIYLNDDFTGFFRPSRFAVQPRAGALLLFHHPQLHEGAVVESGVKYVLRSDVMYAKQSQ